MAVDGTHLFYNPEFTEFLTDNECIGVLLHETAHIASCTATVASTATQNDGTSLADKVVNAVLVAANITLPKGGVPPGPLGKTAEELSEEITDAEMELYTRDVIKAGTMDVPGEKSMTEGQWRDAIAASHGLMPDFVARTVEESTAPRKDWKEELAKFVHSTCKSDTRTWTRQSRRIKGLPGWSRELESNIVIVLDTSGSVTGPILSAFAAECRDITSLNGITAVIMSADAAVHQVIQPGEPFPTTWKGGGGTSFIPALKAAEDYQPNCIIYLTDGHGTYPKNSLYPVLWALTAPRQVPFGEKILLEGITDGN